MSEASRQTLAAVVPTFASEGVKQVFAAECCGRLAVSKARPVRCSTCGKDVVSEAISTNDYVARHD